MLRLPLSLLPSGGCYDACDPTGVNEQFSIRMALASAVHHSHMRVATMAAQTDFVPAATCAATAEAPQVVGSLPLSDDFAAPMYNQVHQEQVVTTVQPHAIFEETPEVQVVERILEHIVEPIEVLPHERVIQRTFKQILHVPVPQIQEQSVVTGLMNPQFSTSAVEALQVVDSFPLLEDVAAREYNQVHQEQIVADSTAAWFFSKKFPEVQVVERIQEQIVEPIEVLPQERVQLHTAIHIMHMPVPQIQEETEGEPLPSEAKSSVYCVFRLVFLWALSGCIDTPQMKGHLT